MAKIKPKLLGKEISGPIGKDLTYKVRAGQQLVIHRAPKADPKSATQLAERALFQGAVETWHTLTAEEKAWYASQYPGVGTNAAYLQFLRMWLMGTVPLHGPTHEKDGADELPLQDLDSDAVGPSAIPLSNIHISPTTPNIYVGAPTSGFGPTIIDLSPYVPVGTLAVLLMIHFRDSASAGAVTWHLAYKEGGWPGCFTPGAHINNDERSQFVLIPITAARTISHLLVASGVLTATCRIALWGWIEPVGVT